MKYAGEFTKEISFPLGGIGTGCIGLGGNGRLMDWEIFNRPNKGGDNFDSHFAVRAVKDDKIIAKVLNGDLLKDFQGQYSGGRHFGGFGYGPEQHRMHGYPHFESTEFEGEFPIASLSFEDSDFPGKIVMTAFNPFIPLDAKNSSIPAAFFELEVENTSEEEMKYQIALSVRNPFKKTLNKAEKKSGYQTITLYNSEVDGSNVEYGDLTIATDSDITYTQTYWYRGWWRDAVTSFWNDFSGETVINERLYDTEGCNDTATLVSEIEACPGEKKKIRFILSWSIPNNYNYWDSKYEAAKENSWKNYYATVFEDSSDSAVYSLRNWDDLYRRTLKFKEALYQSTLPDAVIDAAAANLSVLKSPTVLRLEDGSFYGWEGVGEAAGSCEGTCQHVWNYAYAMCFLFPELERSIRDMEFKYSTDENGRMGFRIKLPLGREMIDFRACVDGQMGAILKCYREWKISGDNAWLKANWENIKKVLEYAWSEHNPDSWDLDKDGVLEGRQHHTLDVELFGPSSWLEGMYLAALKAASEMAEFLCDTEKAVEYRDLFDKGARWTNNNLFNGRYFIHKIDLSDKSLTDRFDASEQYWNDEVNEIKHQIGEGSSIDQVLAQWHADILGLGDIFEREKLDTALSHMMQNNFKPTMRSFVNNWRVFSLNDEAGSVICDYSEASRTPKIPIPYYSETMTGFEYSFAGLLCSRGKADDGIRVVEAVRNRFDGKKRNPWNEFECGSNYARSMASYALIPILSGFEFDMPNNHIGFSPYNTKNFKCIWSLADAWGIFEINGGMAKIDICEGELSLKSIALKFCDNISDARIDGKPVAFQHKDGRIYFEKTAVQSGVELVI